MEIRFRFISTRWRCCRETERRPRAYNNYIIYQRAARYRDHDDHDDDDDDDDDDDYNNNDNIRAASVCVTTTSITEAAVAPARRGGTVPCQYRLKPSGERAGRRNSIPWEAGGVGG